MTRHWIVDIEPIEWHARHGVVRLDGAPASFADVVAGLRTDPSLADSLSDALAGVSFSAYKWECPAVTEATVGASFEFVVLDAPRLERNPRPEAFAGHFDGHADVVAFPSLGGDAMLVAPCPQASPETYAHLASFVRTAPVGQQQALWRRVGEELAGRIGEQPLWLSTAGGGVAWLHVRLDSRPKYYDYEPYRRRA